MMIPLTILTFLALGTLTVVIGIVIAVKLVDFLAETREFQARTLDLLERIASKKS